MSKTPFFTSRLLRFRRVGGRLAPWLLVGLVMVLHGCNNFFYYPDRVDYASQLPQNAAASRHALDLYFASADSTRLHARFLPSRATPSLGTVIHFHGNAQNLTSHAEYSEWLTERGFHVFIFDYRGYGRSEGSVSRQGIHEDAVAALRYVRTLPEVDPTRLVVFGQSLGGAIAIAALGEGAPESLEGIRAVAIDSAFSSYISMGNEVLGGTFFTYPLAWLLLSNRHSPDAVAAKLAPIPMLFMHGKEDPVVPYRQGRWLFEAAGEPKEFVDIPAAGHNSFIDVPEARERLVRFFETALGR